MTPAPSLALAFDAGDVKAALEAATQHLLAGESLRDLYLSAARAAVRKYWYESLDTDPLHALMSIDAGYAIRTWLPDSADPPFAEDASPARGLALAQAIAYVAQTHPGPEHPTKPARPTIAEIGPDAMGHRLIEHVKAGNVAAADGVLDLMLSMGKDVRAVARALFTAAAMDPGGFGHKLIFAVHCWNMAEADGAEARFDLLRPAVHLACTKGPPNDVDRIWPIAKRLSVEVPTLRRQKPPGHIIVVSDLILNSDPLTTFVRAFDDHFGVHDLLDCIVVAACASIVKGGDLHSLTYAHAARLAVEITDGHGLLPLFQAAMPDAQRWKTVAIPVTPLEMIEKKERPSTEDLALWAAFEDCSADRARTLKFTQAIVGELQRMPLALHPYLTDAWLAVIDRSKPRRNVAAQIPALSSLVKPPTL